MLFMCKEAIIGMLNERLKDLQTLVSEPDVYKILKLAQQSHENYLVRSTENDLDTAVLYYLEVIKIDPSISEVYYKLASLLWEKGQIDISSAIEQCEKAVELDPNSSMARLYLGYFLKTAGKYNDAEKQFKLAVKLKPLRSGKARIALASTIVQRINSSNKNFVELANSLYYLISGVGILSLDFDTYRVFYRSLVEDINTLNYKVSGILFRRFRNYNLATKVYKSAALQTGKKEIFYSEIANIAIESGNPLQAVKYYRDALKQSPDNSLLWARLTDILQTHYKDSVDEIIECYTHLSKLEPTNSKIFYELGHLYLKVYEKFSAVNAFKQAISLEPTNAYYHNSLAYALVQLDDFDGAVSEYQKAIRLNPDSEWTSVVSQALGTIYHQVKGNFDAAIMAYQTSTLLDPNNVDAYVSLGEVYYDNSDLSNAIDNFCEAIKLDSTIPRIYCCLGLALWEKDFINESIVALEKAVEIAPEYDTALNNLGVVYLDGVGNVEESLGYFSKAIKANPNYALAYYNKGRAFQALGNNSEAANFYQMAVDINKLTNEFDEQAAIDKIYSLFEV